MSLRPWILLGVAASLLLAEAAHADEASASGDDTSAGSTEACVASFDASQALRRDGALMAAKKELLACAQSHCPDVVEQKCSAWLAEVEDAVPSIVLVLPSGIAASDLTVSIDGEAQPAALRGRAVELDPGSHTVSYRYGDAAPREQTVVVAEGEKMKRVVLEIAESEDEPAPAPLAEDGGISPLVWIGFGVAGAGAIVGAITGGLALAKASELEERCPAQRCALSEQPTHDSGNALAHGSTASFAIAGAGAIVGIVGIVLSKGEDRQEATFAPLLGPGLVGLGGRF